MGHKDKDLKVVIREPDGRVVEVNDERQILDIARQKTVTNYKYILYQG
jgi:hypothetical protein